jgi:hypothetical protein
LSRRAGQLALAGIAVVAGLGLASPGRAATARCGMVVEDRLILDRDLHCPENALILRNPRTVVQLNGHLIESAVTCQDTVPTVGITVESSAERAQILGPGVIRGFQTGIAADGTAQLQIRDLRITDSCVQGLALRGVTNARGRDLVLDRNGNGGENAAAVRIEHAMRVGLADSEIFLNDAGGQGAAIDVRASTGCRFAGNRIVANRGAGLRLDNESQGNEIERNLLLAQRPQDVIDQGSDNLFVLNAFERGEGVDPPPSWPLLGIPASPPPGVAGCGVMNAPVGPKNTITVTCPQDTGLRAVRNSVVSYRLLNSFNGTTPFSATCTPGVVNPASSTTGGSITCTNPDSIWTAIIEVTCCLN